MMERVLTLGMIGEMVKAKEVAIERKLGLVSEQIGIRQKEIATLQRWEKIIEEAIQNQTKGAT